MPDKVTVNIETDDLVEAQTFLKAREYMNRLYDVDKLARDAIKYGEHDADEYSKALENIRRACRGDLYE